MKKKTISALIITGVFGCVLGYGYWHEQTHASLYIHLDYQGAEKDKLHDFPQAELSFLDADGKTLANGFSDEKFNFVHLIHPEVGDCHEIEKSATTSRKGMNAWQECFEHLSTWIPKWADQVTSVTIQLSGCTIMEQPVSISQYNSEWFLWWIPHPHIGGKPYTYFRTNIVIKDTDCIQ